MPWCPRWGLFTSCLWTSREAADGSDAPQWPRCQREWNADFGRCFLLPSRQAMRDVCFGEMLGCELQFSPAIGGKDWKLSFLHHRGRWLKINFEPLVLRGWQKVDFGWLHVSAIKDGRGPRWLKSTQHPTPSFSSTKTRQLPKSSQFPDFSGISLKCLPDCPARSTVPLKRGSIPFSRLNRSWQWKFPDPVTLVCRPRSASPTRDHHWHLGWSTVI